MATVESIVREEHVESLTAVIRECVKRDVEKYPQLLSVTRERNVEPSRLPLANLFTKDLEEKVLHACVRIYAECDAEEVRQFLQQEKEEKPKQVTLREAAKNVMKDYETEYVVGFNDGDETTFIASGLDDLEEVWNDFRKENKVATDSVDYVFPLYD